MWTGLKDKDRGGMGGSREKGIRGESVRDSSGGGQGKKKIEKGCNSSSKKGKEKRETRGGKCAWVSEKVEELVF